MSSSVCKILFKSEQICGCCCKMLRGSLFWGHTVVSRRRQSMSGSEALMALVSASMAPSSCAHICRMVLYNESLESYATILLRRLPSALPVTYERVPKIIRNNTINVFFYTARSLKGRSSSPNDREPRWGSRPPRGFRSIKALCLAFVAFK